MANLEIENNVTASVQFWEPLYQTETLTVAAPGTWPKGAVLARRDADDKLVRYNPAGSAGTEIPKFVLTQEVVFDAAGDKLCEVMISGQVRTRFLVDSTDAALTVQALDQLRDFTLIGVATQQLSEFDNQ